MISQAARDAYAHQIEQRGPSWKNLADTIRTGWANAWVEAALLAIDDALRFGPKDPDDGDRAFHQ